MTDDQLREVPVARTLVHHGRLLEHFVDTVRLPGGAETIREVVVHPGAATIVARLDDSRIVLVRQWRHAAGRALWELPAGTCDPGEDPAVTARRELTEETGYSAGRWRDLGHAPLAPGYSTEEMHFYLAEELTEGETHTDEDENLEVRLVSAEELRALARAGEVDVKTLAGLALAGLVREAV